MSNEKKDSFFFEEDPSSSESGLDWSEHSDAFFGHLEELGILQKDSMAPMGAQVDMQMSKIETTYVRIEFGVVGKDYVVHTIPSHPKRNFQDPRVLKAAMYTTIQDLNRVIPYDLQVDVFPPNPDWEIKAVSYVVRNGADAWNLDRVELEVTVLPKIMHDLTKLCVGGS